LRVVATIATRTAGLIGVETTVAVVGVFLAVVDVVVDAFFPDVVVTPVPEVVVPAVVGEVLGGRVVNVVSVVDDAVVPVEPVSVGVVVDDWQIVIGKVVYTS
jgi:hypothetical protein